MMRPWLFGTVLAVLLPALGLAGVAYGAADLSWADAWQALWTHAGPAQDIVWSLRLPRVLLAAVVGAHFAASGLLLQSALRNPLADPGVLSISAGATLAVMVFLLLDSFAGSVDSTRLDALPADWLPLIAQAGGLLGAALVYGLAWQQGAAPQRLLLTGIVLSAVLYAAALGILAGWGSSRVEVVLTWLSGSLYARDWLHLKPLLPWTLLGLLLLPWIIRPLSVLSLGDDPARSLGLPTEAWRFAALALASVFAASAVGVSGPLAFVGLLVPHMVRLLLPGPPLRHWPLVLLTGAALTMLADTVGRSLLAPTEIPVGAVTALIGAPCFVLLLSRRRAL